MTHPVAIIGMAGRFPKAKNVWSFWELLRDGVEVIERIPEHMVDSRRDAHGRLPPQFVPMGVYLEDVEYFDCGLFGVGQRDAMIMDPQQRLFIEQAWAAAEDAGYDITNLGERVAVYAGAGPSRHALDAMEVFGHDSSTMFEIVATGIDKPMAMRVSHLFDLRGESVYIYAACATSLVTIDMAFNALQEGRADAAIAGASVLYLPQMEGYDYAEGAVRSSDGHCRAFDASADGTVWGSGVGVVVLKRLEHALRDRDHVHALIIGSAVNNDGAAKASFAAPSRDGQADVIRLAMRRAGVRPEDIDFVEAHGTGTEIGDPIEVESLTSVFGAANGPGTCTLGSVKTNIGHLDPAAGVAGLLKTVLALENEAIPKTLHFQRPNPAIDFSAGPFAVNAGLKPWPRGGRVRRAGVNSFGVGGTNAHVVVEEAPAPPPREDSARRAHLVTLSARTPSALRVMSDELARHIERLPGVELRDVAFTRNAGRRAFAVRSAYVADTCEGLASALREPGGEDSAREQTAQQPAPKLAFVFPGQGSQAVDMAAEVYAAETVFRNDLDECAEILAPLLGRDIRGIIFPDIGGEAAAEELLRRTDIQQPVLFAVSFSLARLYESWGCRPVTMIGHSVGEYVAMALSGTLPPASVLRLLVARGRVMQESPQGSMLVVSLPVEDLREIVPDDLDIAAVNGPASCVVSGTHESVSAFEAELGGRGLRSLRLRTSHAFHSRLMDGALERYRTAFADTTLSPPARPWISNVTGRTITDEQATDPSYWVEHLRATVRFCDGVAAALEGGVNVFLELGGRPTLGGPILQTAAEYGHRDPFVISATRNPNSPTGAPDTEYLHALGGLWKRGVKVDWNRFHAEDGARRVPLSHYPFEGVWVALTQEGQDGQPRHRPAAAAAPGPQAGGVNALPSYHAAAPTAARAPRPSDYEVAYAEPGDEVVAEVAEIFSRVLGVAPVGADDNIFDLGGTSIMLVHVVNQLRTVFELNVPIKEVVANPFPARLADVIRRLRAEAPPEEQTVPNRD